MKLVYYFPCSPYPHDVRWIYIPPPSLPSPPYIQKSCLKDQIEYNRITLLKLGQEERKPRQSTWDTTNGAELRGGGIKYIFYTSWCEVVLKKFYSPFFCKFIKVYIKEGSVQLLCTFCRISYNIYPTLLSVVFLSFTQYFLLTLWAQLNQ